MLFKAMTCMATFLVASWLQAMISKPWPFLKVGKTFQPSCASR